MSASLHTQGSPSLTWAGWGASVWGGWCEGVRRLLRPSCSERWPTGGERICWLTKDHFKTLIKHSQHKLFHNELRLFTLLSCLFVKYEAGGGDS